MTNASLIEHLKRKGVLKTPNIVRAFEEIDRADFVPDALRNEAYEDEALPIGYGVTISQPYTVAFMLELLQPQNGEKILDVGSGSGWTTALLASTVGEKGEVIGVEIIPELVCFGRENLEKCGFRNARIEAAGEALGNPSASPFDKILVSAASRRMPEELITQLKVGGRLIVPIGLSLWQIDKRGEVEIERKEFPGFVFVPLKQ